MSNILLHGAHDFHPGGFCPDYYAVPYQFTAPERLRVLQCDGSAVLMGYGVGEIIFAWEPISEFLIMRRKRREAIALCDGTWIIDLPEDIACRRLQLETIAGHKDVWAYEHFRKPLKDIKFQ